MHHARTSMHTSTTVHMHAEKHAFSLQAHALLHAVADTGKHIRHTHTHANTITRTHTVTAGSPCLITPTKRLSLLVSHNRARTQWKLMDQFATERRWQSWNVMGFDVDAELHYTVQQERLKTLSVCLLHMQRTLAVKSVAAVVLPCTQARARVWESRIHKNILINTLLHIVYV